MRGVTFILLLIVFVLPGCNLDSVKKSETEKTDTIKQLDWEKTASEQRLKIGDTIFVEGVTTDRLHRRYGRNYDLVFNPDGGIIESKAKKWEMEINAILDKPGPIKLYKDPNRPIGLVISTIYNPSAYNALRKIDDLYPPKILKMSDLPGYEHRLKIKGEIFSFERETIESHSEDTPAYIVSCVRIEVLEIELIDSKHQSLPRVSMKKKAGLRFR
ncbi:MAG: hypothetical protein OXH00_21520 [Candidatus Poribacteria bacterium]|nr:hypothetical protein [Candidatus Poribacteria bacterium]